MVLVLIMRKKVNRELRSPRVNEPSLPLAGDFGQFVFSSLFPHLHHEDNSPSWAASLSVGRIHELNNRRTC